MELVSFALRHTLREYCVSYLSVRVLEDIFYGFGIEPRDLDASEAVLYSSSRRSTIERFYKAFDWSKPQDVERFLHVLNHILALPVRHVGYSIVEMDEQQQLDQQRILRLCLQDRLRVDGKTVSLPTQGGVQGNIKNLIFAANGPKPEIVLADAINNDIRIVKNEQYCLVYDQPIPERGLRWHDLVAWWQKLPEQASCDKKTAENNLYQRLKASLCTSPPEQLFFRTYMHYFRQTLREVQPALIPQVYLHYDPYLLTTFSDKRHLVRQRMDFLLLLSHQKRIVIEIDGQQHYAVDGQARPKLYAEMVCEDRKLKLSGYEVYRFGGHELQEPDGEHVVIAFFQALFQRHFPEGMKLSEENS